MVSLCRKMIAERVHQALISLGSHHSELAMGFIEPLIKVSTKKCSNPEFYLSCKTLHEQRSPSMQFLPAELSAVLLQQMASIGPIRNTYVADGGSETLMFTIDRCFFMQEVLHNTAQHIDILPQTSCVFQNMPRLKVIIEYSFLGHTVTRLNYLGDWGTQYGLLSAGFDQFGCEEELARDPVQHLLHVYVTSNKEAENNPEFQSKAKEYARQLEEGNQQLLSQWKKFRDLSIEHYDQAYKQLGVHFDEYHFESMYSQQSRGIIQMLQEKQLLKEVDGALAVKLPLPDGKEQNVIVAKSDGSTLYCTRDIAAAIDRKKKYNFDRMYYVVENGQAGHFQSLINILKQMGYDWYRLINHVKFGRVHNMSTRKGQMVLLKDLLDEAQAQALESMELSATTKVSSNLNDIARILGTSAIVINDLKARRNHDYSFSWNKLLHNKGDSGISLQYSHARLSSIERNCGLALDKSCTVDPLMEPQALHLCQHLARFEEVIHESYQQLEPCIVVQYLFSLCHLVGSANKVLRVKGENEAVGKARLLLFHTSRKVLHKGMTILGLTPLEEM